VLVSVWGNQATLEASASHFVDAAAVPRFVMLVVCDLAIDWDVGARGGEDFWVRADEIVKMRLAGE
jgi:hypothetical protein